MSQLRKWFPEERITRLCNLAWLMTGLFLARSVHLSHIGRLFSTLSTITEPGRKS